MTELVSGKSLNSGITLKIMKYFKILYRLQNYFEFPEILEIL